MRVDAAARSHPGHMRGNNEDNFFLCGVFMRAEERNAGGLFKGMHDDKRQLYAVCDGMGGMDNGETASLMAVSNMGRLLPAGFRGLAAAMQSYINETSDALQSPPEGHGYAGCTLAAVYLHGSRAVVANLGDSRVYFKRASLPLTQVTEDHSQAMWFVKQGILTPEEAETHQSRNTLRRYIGAPDPDGRTPYVSKAMRVKRGDAFLLCSDGLSNMLTLSEMDNEVSKATPCADICRALVSQALKRPADDNITALVLRVG